MSETMHGVLDAAAAARPDQLVRFPSEGEAVSYRELATSARALAGKLASGDLPTVVPPVGVLPADVLTGGIRRGEPVGVLSPNAPEFLRSLFAVSAAGGAACPLALPFSLTDMAAYSERLARIADVAGMRLVLISPRLGQLADHLAAALPKLTFATGCPSDAGTPDVGTPGVGTPDAGTPHALLHAGSLDVGTPGRLGAPGGPGVHRCGIPGLSDSVPGHSDGFLAVPLPAVAPDDAAIVQFTSGSTALPKGVRLTHRNVLAGLAAISEGIALGDADGGGFWLPLFHDMGLFGVMTGIRAGIPLHIWSPASFVKRPARWLREFLASGATITAMPDFGFRALTAAVSAQEAAELDMTRWRIAFNGAEPVQWPTVHEFTSRFAPSGFRAEAMLSVYGMAEATLAITFPPLGRGPVFDWVDRDKLAAGGVAVPAAPGVPGARAIAGVGSPVLGMELRVASPDSGATLPDGVVGEILIRGASVTEGYLGEVPGGASAQIADGWLRTGDLAYTRGGEVFITGRLKEMITVRGANYYPQDVEVIARDVPGVFRGHCAAVTGHRRASTEYASTGSASTGSASTGSVGTESASTQSASTQSASTQSDGAEEVTLIAETTLTGAAAGELAVELRRRVAAELGLTQLTIRLVKPRAIPRTSSGKVQRLASRDLPARG